MHSRPRLSGATDCHTARADCAETLLGVAASALSARFSRTMRAGSGRLKTVSSMARPKASASMLREGSALSSGATTQRSNPEGCAGGMPPGRTQTRPCEVERRQLVFRLRLHAGHIIREWRLVPAPRDRPNLGRARVFNAGAEDPRPGGAGGAEDDDGEGLGRRRRHRGRADAREAWWVPSHNGSTRALCLHRITHSQAVAITQNYAPVLARGGAQPQPLYTLECAEPGMTVLREVHQRRAPRSTPVLGAAHAATPTYQVAPSCRHGPNTSLPARSGRRGW